MHHCVSAIDSHCFTLAVPKTFGSSLGFNEPAPILGRVDCKQTILPPKGDYPENNCETVVTHIDMVSH